MIQGNVVGPSVSRVVLIARMAPWVVVLARAEMLEEHLVAA